MSQDILLISELKKNKVLKIEDLMMKCCINDIESLMNKFFKIINKELNHITGSTVFSDKDYLMKIFSYLNIIIKENKCDLEKTKLHLDLLSSKVEIKLKQCSGEKYTRFFNKIYKNIEKSRLYIKEKCDVDSFLTDNSNLIEDRFQQLNTLILTATPSKEFNLNYEEYEAKYRKIFKDMLCDENLDKDEVVDRLNDIITKIEDKKLLIKGIPHSRRVKRFLNYSKVIFQDIVNKYNKDNQKEYKHIKQNEVIN